MINKIKDLMICEGKNNSYSEILIFFKYEHKTKKI